MDAQTTVLDVLVKARSRIANPKDWWDGGADNTDAKNCAITAFPDLLRDSLNMQGADAVAAAMGVPTFEMPRWNDSHSHAEVLGAFDKAIATVKLQAHLDATPLADAALEVMAACDVAGAVLARQIVAQHPQMDLQEVTALASAELFYAAQDTTQACELGVTVARA